MVLVEMEKGISEEGERVSKVMLRDLTISAWMWCKVSVLVSKHCCVTIVVWC